MPLGQIVPFSEVAPHVRRLDLIQPTSPDGLRTGRCLEPLLKGTAVRQVGLSEDVDLSIDGPHSLASAVS